MMNSLGARIKKLRLENNISQKNLAIMLDISNSTLCQYESNSRTPNDEVKKKLSLIFNVSLDYLMGVSDVRNPYADYTYNIDLGYDILNLLIAENQLSDIVVTEELSLEKKKEVLNQIQKIIDVSKILKNE